MNKELISRYLKGEVTDTEREAMQAWIESKGTSWMDEYIDEKWDYPAITTGQAEKDYMVEKVMASIYRRQQHHSIPVSSRPGFRPMALLRWAAAACLLIAVAGIGWQIFHREIASKKQLAWHTFRNDSAGVIKKLYLPDSSVVILNSRSHLRLPDNYNDTTREVQLTGEALFEIRHDEKRPFIVHAGPMATRVYGTVFNVSAYPEASQLRIALKKGQIGIRGAAIPEQILQPGELLLYDNITGTIQTDRQAADEIGDWTEGKLHFYKTPLKDVLYTLEKQYGTTFSYHSSLKNQTITADFEKSPLQQVLQHLSFVWDIRFEEVKDSIYVR
ncbi:MAG: FecR domain-containing protein [Bacteroidota bacterium]